FRQAEKVDDIVANFWRGRCRERRDWWSASLIIAAVALRRGASEPTVVRSEVVSPLRHTVRFVDHEPRHGQLPQTPEKVSGCEPLGCDIQQADLAPARCTQSLLTHVIREHRMQRGGGNPPTNELVHMVPRQRS